MKLPVVLTEPVTGTVGQARLKMDTSMGPDNFRQDEATVHDPTTLPPQAETLAQLPPLPVLPPAPFAAPAVVAAPAALDCPAPPGGLDPPEPLLHAAPTAMAASANPLRNPRFAFRMMTF